MERGFESSKLIELAQEPEISELISKISSSIEVGIDPAYPMC